MHISLTAEVNYMKLEILQKRLAIGAEQAAQGVFVDQSVGEIIAELENGQVSPCLCSKK